MSRHEGVSCDSCLKSNFRGRRYKCLICYDYDLCATCYEEGATSTRHSADHPMQCIITRSDFELYYGGENISADQPQSFTCPYCGKMGWTEATLLEHVTAEHQDTGLEVVCPICAALPGGDPNLVTDDFASHLTLEHRTGSRDLISFLDEPSAIRHGGVRRIPHSGRTLGGARSRRSNMHFSSSSGSAGAGGGGGLSTLSPSGRESVDPIAELLQQLSGVRRGAPQPSQLQQLQMQIQLERQQVSAARQQLERLPRRPHPSGISSSGASASANGMSPAAGLTQAVVSLNSNSLRDIPIATSSPLPLGTSAAGLINANATMAAVLAGGTQAVAQAPSTSTAGSSSVAATQQQQAASASAASGTQASQGVENYQFLLPRIFEPSLTEEEIQQRENERAERADYCNEVIFQALRLRDPVRYLVSSDDESDDSDDTDDSDSSLRPTIKPIRVTKSKHKKVTEPPPAATRPETANASTQSEQSSADAMPAGSLQQESVVVTAAATANPNSSHRKIVVNKSTTTRPVSQHQQSAKLAKQQSGPDTR